MNMMTDDEILELAVKAVRADRRERAHEARLEAYAAGEIDAARLAEEARAAGMDAELGDEVVGFKPLDAAARADIAARIALMQAPMRPMRASRPSQRAREARVPRIGAPLRRVGLAVSAIALAASVGLFFRASSSTLPSYEIAQASGEQAWRGEAEGVEGAHHVARADRMRLVVRPSTAITEPVEARVFVRRGSDVRAWPSAIEVSKAGAVRIVATPASLPEGTTGEWEMLVTIGRPGAMPASSDLDGQHAPPRDVRVVTTHVTLD